MACLGPGRASEPVGPLEVGPGRAGNHQNGAGSNRQNGPEQMTASDRIPQVLVVDDEPNIRELVQVALKFHGCAVNTAGTGADALRLAESSRPDLIVLDVSCRTSTVSRCAGGCGPAATKCR